MKNIFILSVLIFIITLSFNSVYAFDFDNIDIVVIDHGYADSVEIDKECSSPLEDSKDSKENCATVKYRGIGGGVIQIDEVQINPDDFSQNNGDFIVQQNSGNVNIQAINTTQNNTVNVGNYQQIEVSNAQMLETAGSNNLQAINVINSDSINNGSININH